MGIAEAYDFYWKQSADPRTNYLPWIESPIIIPSVLILYLYIVLKAGPEFMKNREPYDLKTFTKFYNIVQIVTNGYVVHQFVRAGWFTDISVFCELSDYSYSPNALKIADAMVIGLRLKLLDLVETVVFVLRKKNNQVSFLHLYHHVSTVLVAWSLVKFVPVSMIVSVPLVNSGVHVIMYIYYYLSSYGPSVQKKLRPFKPIITIIQMVQFIVLMLHNILSLLPSCPVEKWPGAVMLINLMINFTLFYNFYQENYIKPARKKE